MTMAVLMHLDRQAEWVLPHIARITPRVLLVEQEEGEENSTIFPRRYQPIFEECGFRLIHREQPEVLPGMACLVMERDG